MPNRKNHSYPLHRMFGGLEMDNDENNTAAEEGILSKIFNGLFLVISVLLCFMITIFFIISIINVNKYRKLRKEHNKAIQNNQVILKNTLDYRLLSYTEGVKSEPLLIKTLIVITNIIFWLIGSFILLICIEFGILIGLSVYSALRGGDASNMGTFLNIKIEKKYVVIMVISLIGAYVVYWVTKNMYIDKTLPSLLKTKQMFYNLKQSIIPNLYINPNFLEVLRNDDIEQIKALIKQKITSGDIDTTTKMIFTYNIYTHYQDIFTISDDIREEIKNNFKPEVLKSSTEGSSFEPAEYLIYTDEDIQLLTFSDNFIDTIVRDDSELQTAFGNKLADIKNKVEVYLKKVNNISKNINKTILEENTKSLVDYIYVTMYTAIFAFVIIMLTLIGVFITTIKPLFTQLIASFWNRLFGSGNPSV